MTKTVSHAHIAKYKCSDTDQLYALEIRKNISPKRTMKLIREKILHLPTTDKCNRSPYPSEKRQFTNGRQLWLDRIQDNLKDGIISGQVLACLFRKREVRCYLFKNEEEIIIFVDTN